MSHPWCSFATVLRGGFWQSIPRAMAIFIDTGDRARLRERFFGAARSVRGRLGA